jgi:hypothetical protein
MYYVRSWASKTLTPQRHVSSMSIHQTIWPSTRPGWLPARLVRNWSYQRTYIGKAKLRSCPVAFTDHQVSCPYLFADRCGESATSTVTRRLGHIHYCYRGKSSTKQIHSGSEHNLQRDGWDPFQLNTLNNLGYLETNCLNGQLRPPSYHGNMYKQQHKMHWIFSH